MGDPLNDLYNYISHWTPSSPRPLVTLTYAQSLDGSISARAGHRTKLSGSESLAMTHRLRALHDGILVGIGTVLSDNPRLTVRHTTGEDPQPSVLDTQLRFPLDAQLARGERRPWIFCAPDQADGRMDELERAGAVVIPGPTGPRGLLDGASVLKSLHERGIRRLMVEGGAKVLSYFLEEQLGDLLVLTISPVYLGGLRPLPQVDGARPLAQVREPRWHQAGPDMVLWGELPDGPV